MNEKKYEELSKVAYKSAYDVLGHREESEDVAQNVCVKYLEKKKKIKKPIAWCWKVARNEAINKKKVNKRTKNLNQTVVYEDTTQDFLDSNEEVDPFKMDLDEVKELLSKDLFRVYKFYIKHNNDLSKIARSLRTKKKSAENLIYRMKKDLTAFKLCKEGWRGTPKIIDYNTQKKLLRFKNKYVKCCKKGDLSSMKKYFNKIDLNKVPIIEFKKIVDFQFHLRSDKNYDFGIPYISLDERVFVMHFTLEKNIDRSLHVIKAVLLNKNIYVHNDAELIEKKQKPKKKGFDQENFKTMKKIILSNGGYKQKED